MSSHSEAEAAHLSAEGTASLFARRQSEEPREAETQERSWSATPLSPAQSRRHCRPGARRATYVLTPDTLPAAAGHSQLYRQQRWMYTHRCHRIADRLVRLSQPHVRPIVRGKAGTPVEFGAKISVSLVDGDSFVDRISWDAYNESVDLVPQIDAYRRRFGHDPASVHVDQIYRTRENRRVCASRGIRLSRPPLGRPRTITEATAEQVKQDRQQTRNDATARMAIEGKLGRQTPVWARTSDGQTGADLRNDDSRVIFGDEFGASPHPSYFFLAVFLVAGLEEYVERPAGCLVAPDASKLPGLSCLWCRGQRDKGSTISRGSASESRKMLFQQAPIEQHSETKG